MSYSNVAHTKCPECNDRGRVPMCPECCLNPREAGEAQDKRRAEKAIKKTKEQQP